MTTPAKTRDELEQQIFASAPLLYRCKTHGYMDPEDVFSDEDIAFHAEIGVTPEPPMRKYPSIHYYGIECGSGWLPVIEAVSTELEKRLTLMLDAGVSADQIPAIFQIKEKFGFLRIAMRGFSPEGIPADIRSLIDEAEKQARQLCESCGAAGLDPERDGMESRCKKCIGLK